MSDIITRTQLKTHLGIDVGDTADDATLQWAADTANTKVRNKCKRSFTVDAGQAASARYFKVVAHDQVWIDDAFEITAVATDDGNDGTWSTAWGTTEWWADPIGGIGPNGLSGWPYTSICIGGTRCFPRRTFRPGAKITGKWGWTAVPDDVFSATLMFGTELWQAKNGGSSVFTADGTFIPQRRNWAALDLLVPFDLTIPGVG